MLDIKLVRENPELIKKNLQKRGDLKNSKMLDDLLLNDRQWRQSLTRLNRLRHERKVITTEISSLKKKGEEIKELVKAKTISKQITILEENVKKYEENIHYYLMQLPNLIHETVPFGRNESDNIQIRSWGKIPDFNFPIKDHVDLGVALDIIDVRRAGKVAGSRFFYLKNEGVLLDIALKTFALEEMIMKGYSPVEPPFLMRRKAYEGVVSLRDFEDVLYKIDGEDLYLIATSEHPIAAMFMGEVLVEKELPFKLVGVSANFRKEAGAHGKDTRGIFRTHQFNKVEQFVFCKPEDSWKIHEKLIRNAEELVKKLGLPYRVMNVCTGDIGTVAAKKYDVEVWMPAQNTYKEIISCSNCTDYQSRRLNIKYREKRGASPKDFVHTLNSTALATGRTIVAILENYQEEGAVAIPKPLRKYMGNKEKMKFKQ